MGGRAKGSMAEPLGGAHAKMVHSNLKTSQQVWTMSRGFEVTLSIWGSHGNFISLRAALKHHPVILCCVEFFEG